MKKKLLPGWAVILLDVTAIGLALCVFALFHHVIPKDGGGPKRSIVTVSTPSPTPVPTPAPTPQSEATEATATPSPTPEPTPVSIGNFSATFPKDDNTSENTIHSYQSDNVRVAVDKISENGITYYAADIYIRDISYLRTAFADDKYGQGYHEGVTDMSERNNAIIAVSGDYYGARSRGIVIRNGDLYRDSLFGDVCVIYQDGVMRTYSKDDFSIDEAVENGAYQAWSFGPMLLDNNGQAMTEFDSKVTVKNPRCSIGYYAPGHYCIIVVDGRQKGYSSGMTMEELSNLYYSLGCTAAYNLDGGQTAMMAFDDEIINKPINGGRQSSDIVYIGE